MNGESIQVILGEKHNEQLRSQVFHVIKKAVDEARDASKIDSPWLNSKKSIAKWMDVSFVTLNVLIQNGLPIHYIEGVNKVFANKNEISEWMSQQ